MSVTPGCDTHPCELPRQMRPDGPVGRAGMGRSRNGSRGGFGARRGRGHPDGAARGRDPRPCRPSGGGRVSVARADRRARPPRGVEGMGRALVCALAQLALRPRPARAYERVRVACVTGLPRIHAAFGEARLRSSKVRALTRVATSATEEDLVQLATHATASDVERMVRAYRGVVDAETEREEANGRHERRALHWWWDADGSLVLPARLSPEDGALVVRALERVAAAVGAECSAEHSVADAPFPARCADALVSIATQPGARTPAVTGSGATRSWCESMRRSSPMMPRASATSTTVRRLRRRRPAASPATARSCRPSSPLTERHSTWVGAGDRSLLRSGARFVPATEGVAFPAVPSNDGSTATTCSTGHEATKLANLVELCRHHHRLVHEGGFRLSVDDDGGVRVHRPDGRLLRVGEPDGVLGDREMARTRDRGGIGIDDATNLGGGR